MIAAKQKGYKLSLFRYSDILLKKIINKIYSVDKTFRVIKIMDFNRTGCHSTMFPYVSSTNKWGFVVHSTTPYIHPRFGSRIKPKFSDCGMEWATYIYIRL